MEKLIYNIAEFHNIKINNQITFKIISHINKSPSHISKVFYLLFSINQLFLFFFKIFGFKKTFIIKLIFKYKPLFLYMIYRLILSLLILSSIEKK